jgi:TolB-like protein
MFELLTGHLPFSGEYESAMMYTILNEPPLAITDFRNDLPEGAENIVCKALMKNVSDRYQDVSEVISDLTAVKEGQKVNTDLPENHESPSIAVLPFANMSNDPEQEYFCEGMSDEIINALTQVDGMHVVARTSAFSFKGQNADIREIGEKLNVNTILEGSVRKSDNRLRIMAQLIKVSDGYHLWSERYDRELDDVFAIQDEISLSIVDKLKKEILGEQPQTLVERATDNMEAYSLYLKGLHYRSRLAPDTQTKAVECFKKAIQLDPEFARSYASLAGCYVEMTDIGGLALLSRDEAYPLVKEAVDKALSLDPSLSEAQVLKGLFKAIFDWDWLGGDRLIQKAIRQNPKDVYSLMWCTYFFWLTVRLDEAIDIALKTESYDPLSSIAQYKVATSYYHAKKYDEAIKRYQHIIEVDENFFLSYILIGFSYTDKGKFENALKMYKKALNKFGRHWIILNSMASMYGRWGKRSEAVKILDELKKLSEKEMINPSHFAWSTLALGNEEQAILYFEEAFEKKDLFLMDALKFPWPEMEAIRNHPRIQAIMEKMNYIY